MANEGGEGPVPNPNPLSNSNENLKRAGPSAPFPEDLLAEGEFRRQRERILQGDTTAEGEARRRKELIQIKNLKPLDEVDPDRLAERALDTHFGEEARVLERSQRDLARRARSEQPLITRNPRKRPKPE